MKIGVMDDRDFKINLAFDECCSILNDISLSLSLFVFLFQRDRSRLSIFYRFIDGKIDTGGDRVENYEKIVRRFIEGVEMRERERGGNFLLRFLEKLSRMIE